MVRVANGEHEGHEDKTHMKLDDKSQHITQITQIIESVKSVKSVDKDIKQQKTQKTQKRFVFFVKSVGNKKTTNDIN